jgi:uncharacterized membrane protein
MLLFITTIITGLIAGVFFCWSVSVTKGLAPLPDKEYIDVFQSLNREIQNPLFFICFFGAAILLPVSTWQHYEQPLPLRFWLLLAASVIYLVGVIAVTVVGNIPMNESLDTFNTASATMPEMATCRINFEKSWNQLNNIRTVASVIAFVLIILACFVKQPIEEIKI